MRTATADARELVTRLLGRQPRSSNSKRDTASSSVSRAARRRCARRWATPRPAGCGPARTGTWPVRRVQGLVESTDRGGEIALRRREHPATSSCADARPTVRAGGDAFVSREVALARSRSPMPMSASMASAQGLNADFAGRRRQPDREGRRDGHSRRSGSRARAPAARGPRGYGSRSARHACHPSPAGLPRRTHASRRRAEICLQARLRLQH